MSIQQLDNLYLQTVLENNTEITDIFTIYNRLLPSVNKWMECIFSGTHFETDIHCAYNNTDLLRHFYAENKNRIRANGAQTFGFSFPYLFFTESDGKKITAPLFTWYLNIKPHPSRIDSWRIGFEDKTTPIANAELVAYLKNEKKIDISEILNAFMASKKDLEKAMLDCSFDLSKKLSTSCSALIERIREFPTKNNYEIVMQRRDVLWCGTLGFFPHVESGELRVESGDVSLESKKNNINASLVNSQLSTLNFTHEFGYFEKDITQYAAFRTALQNSLSVIEGAYNTGKKYILTDILINALSQKQKVLVVCKNVQELIYIQNGLVKLGLGHLTFLLKDIYADKDLFLSTLRDDIKNKSAVKVNSNDFQVTLKQWRRALNYSDAQHTTLSQPVFGPYKVSDIVGLFSESNRIVSKSILNSLKPSDYEFTETVHSEMHIAIDRAQELYPAVGSLKHPLALLHPHIFLQNNLETAKHYCQENLKNLIESVKEYQHRSVIFYTYCSEQITTYYEKKANIISEQIRHFKEDYSDLSFQHGTNLETNNFLRLSGLHASAIFSDKSKAVLEAREQLLKAYDALQSFFETDPIFQHSFLKGSEKNDPVKIIANIETLQAMSLHWRKSLPNLVQDAMQRLNTSTSQNLHDGQLTKQVISLEKEFETLIVKINATKIYENSFVDNRLTLNKKIQFSGEIIELLEDSQLNLRDFDSFYSWQKFWLNLSQAQKNIIETLIKLKPVNWGAAFDSWFYNNILMQNHNAPITSTHETQSQLAMLDQKLHSTIIDYIIYTWSTQIEGTVKKFKSENKVRYEKLFTSSGENDKLNTILTELTTEEINTISSILPVLLVTPSVATYLTHNTAPVFDRILFYNASSIDTNQAIHILKGGVSATLFDEYAHNQGLPVNSFAALARTLKAPVTKLEFLHQPQSLVNDMNEKVFYKNLKSTPLSIKIQQEIRWIDVNVKSAQNKIRNINFQEIETTIELLKNLDTDPSKTVNRIGILCFSKEQRDALIAAILQIIQKTERKWEKLEHLNRTGLWIGCVSEIAGQKFETLIVNNTFTDVDSPNLTLTDWRTVLNSFTNQLYWINSIRLDILRDEARTKDDTLSSLYAHFATWIYDTANKDSVQSAITLSNLSFQFGIKEKPKYSIWLDTLSNYLESEYGKKRVEKNYSIDSSYTVALVLLPDDELKPLCVFQIDGSLSELHEFHHAAWEQKLQYRLTQRPIQIIKVSSYNFWKNESETKVKIVSDIETAYTNAKNALYKKSQIVLK